MGVIHLGPIAEHFDYLFATSRAIFPASSDDAEGSTNLDGGPQHPVRSLLYRMSTTRPLTASTIPTYT